MQIGDIEKHLHESCKICDLKTVDKALDTLIAFLPRQLVSELYLRSLAISVNCVMHKKERELLKQKG